MKNKIADSHIHIIDLNKFTYPWLDDFPTLKKNHLFADYCAVTADMGIGAMIFIEGDVSSGQKNKEIEYLSNIAAQVSVPSGIIISANLLDEGFYTCIDAIKKNRFIKGVRHLLHLEGQDPGTCLQPQFVKNVQELGKHNLVFEACIKPPWLNSVVELAKQAPRTVIIVNHMGNVAPQWFMQEELTSTQKSDRRFWEYSMKMLASYQNMVCKISGLNIDLAKNEVAAAAMVRYCVEIFPSDRIVIGSNYPVYIENIEAKSWFLFLRKILQAYPVPIQESIFYKNAEIIYSLAPVRAFPGYAAAS